VTTLTRLLDVLALTAGDRRIQTVFTHDEEHRSALAAGVQEALDDLGASFLPWRAATGTRFDVALAASENDELAELQAPVLLLPHGAGYQKFYPGASAVAGLDADRLVMGGRVVPAAIGVSHPSDLVRLRELCPPAASIGVVVGDPALARMQGSQFRSGDLRAGFGGRDKCVVVVASTYGPDSVLGRLPDLPERLVASLPADEYRVLVALHPGVWAAHGPWQVRAWLASAVAYGVQVVTPREGWQAALLAASVVISDHGSMGVYAAALGKPVVLAGRGSAVTVPGSAASVLAVVAPIWDAAADPRRQLETVIREHRPAVRQEVMDVLVDPSLDAGGTARRLREVVYQLLGLAEPAMPAAFAPVAVPALPSSSAPAWVAGARLRPDGIGVERYPDLSAGPAHTGLAYRHLVADARTASLAQMNAAAVVVTDYRAAGSVRRWREQASEQLAFWPQATVLAGPVDQWSCAIRTAQGQVMLTVEEPVDPVLLASLAYVRLVTGGQVPARDRLFLGDRAIEVAAVVG
jgi:hypothetical protein